MDTVSAKLSKFALGLKFEDLSEEVLHKAKQMLLDTLGCALGGYKGEPSQITSRVVTSMGGAPESTIIGSGVKIPCANAALANGVMVRYLDFNDVYPGTSHPSESIPTSLAVGEKQHITGKELITSIVIGYELNQRLGDAIKLQFRHVKQFDFIYGAFCSPIIAGKLLGLTEKQMVNAVGISGSQVALGGTRLGEHMLKAITYPLSAQNGIKAALLAKEGFTAGKNVIEVFHQASGGDLDELAKLAEGEEKLKILKAGIKPYASEYMMHPWIEAVLTLQKEHRIKPEDIEIIQVKTFKRGLHLARPDAYHPQTREKADHSGVYCMAIALIEGNLGPDQFARQQWTDPKVLELMAKIKCTEDPELTELYPAKVPVIVEIHTQKSDVFNKRLDVNKGHPNNPMSDEEIQAKFRNLASKLMDDQKIDRVIDSVYNIEAEKDACDLMQLLAAG